MSSRARSHVSGQLLHIYSEMVGVPVLVLMLLRVAFKLCIHTLCVHEKTGEKREREREKNDRIYEVDNERASKFLQRIVSVSELFVLGINF